MDLQEEKVQSLLNSWQLKTFDFDKQKDYQKVDGLRYCLSQLKFVKHNLQNCRNNNAGNEYNFHDEITKLSTNYSTLMDSKENVNNYGSTVLHLNQKFLTDNKNWKCNLNVTDISEKQKRTKINESVLGESTEDYSTVWRVIQDSEPLNIEDLLRDEKSNVESQPLTKEIPDHKLLSEILKPGFSQNEKFPNSVSSSKKEFSRKRSLQEDCADLFDTNSLHNGSTFQSNSKFCKKDDNSMNSSIKNSENPSTSSEKNFYQDSNNSFRRENSTSDKASKRYPWEKLKKSTIGNNEVEVSATNSFRTASHQLALNNAKKFGSQNAQPPPPPPANKYGSNKRCLGLRRAVNSKFTPPIKKEDDEDNMDGHIAPRSVHQKSNDNKEENPYAELMLDERMKNIDPKMVELIMNEIMNDGLSVTWEDIAGLELAKSTIQEIVVLPMLRPDIFTGIRRPPKGLLLFGPPGTGKTMIGKCIASQSKSTFFSISASSLTSKWVGEGEKMVRAMFAVAKCHQPAVIFIDEIDSLLTQRSESEHESSRRLKTEFLVQLDGATTGEEERILVVGATNRPQELDEAARRRLVKRLYIPLPNKQAREKIILNLLTNQKHNLNPSDVGELSEMTEGYSGADMANLCSEASLGPIRSLKFGEIQHIAVDEVRPIARDDFVSALNVIRASVSERDLDLYNDWNLKYGIKR